MSIDRLVMDLLVCPSCRGAVVERPARDAGGGRLAPDGLGGEMVSELVCEDCGRAYPVLDGIPVLLVDYARQV